MRGRELAHSLDERQLERGGVAAFLDFGWVREPCTTIQWQFRYVAPAEFSNGLISLAEHQFKPDIQVIPELAHLSGKIFSGNSKTIVIPYWPPWILPEICDLIGRGRADNFQKFEACFNLFGAKSYRWSEQRLTLAEIAAVH